MTSQNSILTHFHGIILLHWSSRKQQNLCGRFKRYGLSRCHTSDSCNPNQQDGSLRFLCELTRVNDFLEVVYVWRGITLNEKVGGKNYVHGANNYDYRMSNWSVFFSRSRGEIENRRMMFTDSSDWEAGMDQYTSKLSPAVDYGAGTFLLVVGKRCFFILLLKYKWGFTFNGNPLNYT